MQPYIMSDMGKGPLSMGEIRSGDPFSDKMSSNLPSFFRFLSSCSVAHVVVLVLNLQKPVLHKSFLYLLL